MNKLLVFAAFLLFWWNYYRIIQFNVIIIYYYKIVDLPIFVISPFDLKLNFFDIWSKISLKNNKFILFPDLAETS